MFVRIANLLALVAVFFMGQLPSALFRLGLRHWVSIGTLPRRSRSTTESLKFQCQRARQSKQGALK